MMINRLSNLNSDYLISEIVAALERNKEKHVTEYKTALVEYDRQRLSKAESWLYDLNNGTMEPVPANFGLKQPKLMAKEYDRMIAIFKQTEKAVSKRVDLTAFGLEADAEVGKISLDFDQADAIFNDNWDWVQDAKFINGTYAALSMR